MYQIQVFMPRGVVIKQNFADYGELETSFYRLCALRPYAAIATVDDNIVLDRACASLISNAAINKYPIRL